MLYIKANHLTDGLYNIKDGEIFKYKAKGGTVRTYEIGELVRCKECKHRKKNGFCLEHNRYEKNDNGYCFYGERREP